MNKRKILPLCLFMICAASHSVYASSPEFARTEEEWIKLRDNTLEYEEIDGLIEEYNAAIQKSQLDYNDFIKEYGMVNDEISEKYHELADNLEESIIYPDEADPSYAIIMMSIISNESQIDSLREQADEVLEDSKIKYITIEKNKALLSKTAKEKRISMELYKKNIESTQLSIEDLERQLLSAKRKAFAGMMTNIDIDKIENSINEKRNDESSIKNEYEKTKKELLIMTGWNQDANAKIKDIPDVNVEEIKGVLINEDKMKAIENNFDLKILNRKLENAIENKTIGKLELDIKNQKETIYSTVDSAYKNLQTQLLTYEYAEAQKTLQEQTHEQMKRQYLLGICSLNDLKTSETSLKLAVNNLETQKINLFKTHENYKAIINGLIG